MVMILTMIVVNIHEAKARLSEFVDAAAGGEQVVICRRNQPVAELRPVAATRTTPRLVGEPLWPFAVPASIMEPLSGEDLAAFVEGSPITDQQRIPEQPRAAERPHAPSGARPRTRRPRRP
jgi:prevent-host-death family protein